MKKCKSRHLRASIALGAALMAISIPVTAQHIGYYSPPPYVYYNAAVPITVMNQSIKNQALDKLEALESDRGSAKTSGSSADTKDSNRPAPGSASARSPYAGRASATNNPLPYQRDAVLSRKIRDRFLDDADTRMPKVAPTIRELTGKNDFVQLIAGMAQLQGLDSGTVEGLLALWFGQAWAIAHQKPLPTPQQYRGIAVQLKTNMAKAPELRDMSNVNRQVFFEQMSYPLLIQKLNYQGYLERGETRYISDMAADSQKLMMGMGINLQSLKLTNRGFLSL